MGMSKTNNFVFIILKIVSWVLFIGLSIESGGLLVNFIFSVFRPEFVQNLYQKLDLSELYRRSQIAFFSLYGFILVISILKAVLFYVAVLLVTYIDLSKPFNGKVSQQISLMSYLTFSIGILSYLARHMAKKWLQHGNEMAKLSRFWEDGHAFILMAAVIYIIAVVFQRGIELQTEKDLTI
jgi:Protein of unknown function (DUF2975)